MVDLVSMYEAIRRELPADLDVFASQEGEDMLLRRLLKRLYAKPGFYVDVGAFHPTRFSTTLHFYLRGWRGINIEPNPAMLDLFEDLRPEDTNLNLAVSGSSKTLSYYCFREPAFNTCSESRAMDVPSPPLRTVQVTCKPLRDILAEHLSDQANEQFRFMNIDVEGLELDVLVSGDWEKYRPSLVLVEALDEDARMKVSGFLSEREYSLVARTRFTYFFATHEFRREYVD